MIRRLSPGVSYPLLGPAGAAGAPSFAFSAEPTLGIFRESSGVLSVGQGGSGRYQFAATSFRPGGNNSYTLGINLQRWLQVFVGTDGLAVEAVDGSASPGAATANRCAGKNAIALGAASVVITDSKVTATSMIFITPLDLDATLIRWKAEPASGSFTVTGNANATAAFRFQWLVVNP